MGNQSHPVEPGWQPEASHAWWWGNPPCEALTASAEAVLLSPEIAHPRVALGFASSGAVSDRRMAWRLRSRRGLRTGHRHRRVPQELGTPCDSTRKAA
jgi:hypothetical protein